MDRVIKLVIRKDNIDEDLEIGLSNYVRFGFDSKECIMHVKDHKPILIKGPTQNSCIIRFLIEKLGVSMQNITNTEVLKKE